MEEKSLKQKTISGGIWVGFGQIASVTIGLIGTYFLARRLLPEDFGIIQKVVAFTGMTAILGDLGLSLATIQSKEISEPQLSALFWLNVIFSVAIACVMAACAPLIMWFYNDLRVLYIALLFAGLALTKGLFIQHTALLKRNLKYKPVAISTTVGAICGLTSAIFSAPYIGYFALLLQRFVSTIVTGIWVWHAASWRPQLCLCGTGVRPMVKMAGNFTAWSIMGYGIRNLDNVLIGKFWGDAALGLYSKAYGLLLTPLNQISVPLSQVAIPALSRIQTDSQAYRSFFRRGCSLSMIIQVPLAIFSVVACEELVLLVLGEKWIECIPLFLALSPALLSASTSPTTSWIYLSRGDTGRMMKALLCTGPFYIACFFVGIWWGPLGVAISFAITSILVRIPNIWYAIKPSPVTGRDVIGCITLPVVAAAIAGAIAWIFTETLDLQVGQSFVLKSVIFGAVYLLVLFLTPTGRDSLRFLLDQVHSRQTREAGP